MQMTGQVECKWVGKSVQLRKQGVVFPSVQLKNVGGEQIANISNLRMRRNFGKKLGFAGRK